MRALESRLPRLAVATLVALLLASRISGSQKATPTEKAAAKRTPAEAAELEACWQSEARGSWTARHHSGPLDAYMPRAWSPDRRAVVRYRHDHASCWLPWRSPSCFVSAERYEWRPDTPGTRLGIRVPWLHRLRIPRVDRAAFCEATGRAGVRSIAFVGDSLMWQMLESLWLLVGLGGLPRQDEADGKTARVPCAGNRSVSFTMVHASGLLRDRASDGVYDLDGDASLLQHVVKAVARADLSVLNFGAHYSRRQLRARAITEEGSVVFEKDMRELAAALAAQVPASTRLVWRSTPPGHPHCLETSCVSGLEYGTHTQDRGLPSCKQLALPTADAHQPHPRTSLGASPRTRPSLSDADADADEFDSFDWEHFASMDRQAWRLLRPLGARYLDVSPMSALRPDAHTATFDHASRKGGGSLPPDCLHWSLPGVPDVWNAMLLGALRDCG